MLKKIIGLIAIVYVGVMGYLYLTQEAQIFPGFAPTSQPNPLQKLTLEVPDSVILEGRLAPASSNTSALLLYFGGNADDATAFALHVKALQGYDILAFNYRGFGLSGGKASEKALFEDALAIYDRFAQGKEVVIVGRSLGSGVASFLASKRPTQGLVLITPYDSIVSMAQKKYPFLPISYLLKHRFESTRYVRELTCPIAIIEVDHDTTIPRHHLEQLLKALPHSALHVKLLGTTHGDVLEHPELTQTLQTLLGKMHEQIVR